VKFRERTRLPLVYAMAILVILSASALAKERLVIAVPHAPGHPRAVWFEALIDDFKTEYPDVQVELNPRVSGSRIGYPDTINVMIAGGNSPDLAYVLDRDLILGGWAQDGVLVDLSNHLNEHPQLRQRPFLDNVLRAWSYNGKLLALPVGVGMSPLFYDQRLIDEAGLVTPSDEVDRGNWTTETFLAAARKLTRVDGSGTTLQWGLGTLWDQDYVYPAFIYSNGGEILSEEFSRSRVHEVAATEAIQFLE